ncbi:SDR family oxidoreductase [Rhodobacteraceae bacterium CCMM004]|nr:SDR family oxidoreductase [Rhodobacteraceae bacterium CCMM004]
MLHLIPRAAAALAPRLAAPPFGPRGSVSLHPRPGLRSAGTEEAAMDRLAVIGGAGGIGRALCARARSQGTDVVVMDLAASLAAQPDTGERREIDLADPAMIARAFDGLGPVDGVVNLAGYMSPLAPLAETPAETLRAVLETNLAGAATVSRAARPWIRPGGALVHVASGLAHNVRPGFGPYAMAKAGMIALTKTLALEWAPAVRVNAVAPGAVDTAFLRGGTGRAAADAPTVDTSAYAAATPMGRMAVPEDVVGPILFLLGPDAGFVTGQVVWVNGGNYMP